MRTNTTDENQTTRPLSLAGWSAIASGTIGLFAYGSLMAYLSLRSASPEISERMLRLHDGGVILQFLLLIPVVVGLRQLSRQRPPGLGRVTVVTGIAALCAAVLLLVLIFPKVVWDVLYMFPQGLFGVWLMVLNGRMGSLLPGWLRISGWVVGFGLMLVGLFPLGYGLFVDPIALRIPVAAPEEFSSEFSPLNAVLHQILFIGSYLGVATLPFWSALLGWRLLRRSSD